MSDLGWRADGIERALAAGGIELERYRRPGFTGGDAVRRSRASAGGQGFPIESDPDPGTVWDRRKGAQWRAPRPARS